MHPALPQTFVTSLVSWAKDAGFRPVAQWIIWRVWALSDHAKQGVGDARIGDFR
jgi:hypothetical protein